VYPLVVGAVCPECKSYLQTTTFVESNVEENKGNPKMQSLYEFMKSVKDCELKVGLRKMYYENGTWIVMAAKSNASKYVTIGRFLESEKDALSDALACLRGYH